jgi:hypothetical protein
MVVLYDATVTPAHGLSRNYSEFASSLRRLYTRRVSLPFTPNLRMQQLNQPRPAYDRATNKEALHQ